MSALLSPPLLSHDIEGSLPEEDGFAFPDRKSSQFELPSAGPDDEFAEGLETRDISQQKKRYVNISHVKPLGHSPEGAGLEDGGPDPVFELWTGQSSPKP